MQKNLKCEIDYLSVRIQRLSAEARDLISKLIVYEPSERLSLQETMNHKWLNGLSLTEEAPNPIHAADNAQNHKDPPTPNKLLIRIPSSDHSPIKPKRHSLKAISNHRNSLRGSPKEGLMIPNVVGSLRGIQNEVEKDFIKEDENGFRIDIRERPKEDLKKGHSLADNLSIGQMQSLKATNSGLKVMDSAKSDRLLGFHPLMASNCSVYFAPPAVADSANHKSGAKV